MISSGSSPIQQEEALPLLNQRQAVAADVVEVLSGSPYADLFPSHLELIPQLNETYELQLAYYESRLLNDDGLIRNGAYFARVGNQLTRHFLMCSGEPVRLPQHSSSRLRSFFSTNQFKTGYATHGLFPYRGKFHPQMIKALLNTMGLKPGEIVLDPMMGSGTVLIEARLMGIESVGVDASPFCRFMTQVKIDGLTLPLDPVREALHDSQSVFRHFRDEAGPLASIGETWAEAATPGLYDSSPDLSQGPHPDGRTPGWLPEGCDDHRVYNFLLLAYLDSAGYSQRSSARSPYAQFHAILERYLFVAEKVQSVLAGAETELADAMAIEGDARELPIGDCSVDGILFSPPYSFAIDYLENDAFHLGFMGVDVDALRKRMLGLRGRSKREKYEEYREDMGKVLAECSRVLRPGRLCTVVIGTNNNQLASILGVSRDKVQGLDGLMVELASESGLRLVRRMERQITGMANTMRTEFIVILQRPAS